jgi:hypothetical protein
LFIILVSIQKLFAEFEKTRIRQTVVFQNYRPIDQAERPIQAATNSLHAAKVRFGIVSPNLTRPIDALINYLTGQIYICNIGRMIIANTICDQQKSLGPRGADPVKHSSGVFRTIKDE